MCPTFVSVTISIIGTHLNRPTTTEEAATEATEATADTDTASKVALINLNIQVDTHKLADSALLDLMTIRLLLRVVSSIMAVNLSRGMDSRTTRAMQLLDMLNQNRQGDTRIRSGQRSGVTLSQSHRIQDCKDLLLTY